MDNRKYLEIQVEEFLADDKNFDIEKVKGKVAGVFSITKFVDFILKLLAEQELKLRTEYDLKYGDGSTN